MSQHDQCPSSKKEGKPVARPRPAAERSHATGKAYWRSLEELADTPDVRERLEREFPAMASEIGEETRRDFLKLMAASLALAGVVTMPACRRTDHKIFTYNRDPENVIPGNFLFYATAMPLPGGGAQGLLAKTVTGRPIKIEGNPLHPINQGRSDVLAQASVLDLYDPDRSRSVRQAGEMSDWRGFQAFARPHFARFDATQGEGLVFLVEKITSPSRDAMRDRLLRKWPKARWLAYEPIDDEGALEGLGAVFGAPVRARVDFAKARIILSVDDNFLGDPGALAEARGFAAGRRVWGKDASTTEMNRLYAVESAFTITGGAADHRLKARPTETPAIALAIVASALRRLGAAPEVAAAAEKAGAPAEASAWIDAVAEDLAANKGRAVVTVGRSQPAAVHAAVAALNAALEAPVTYLPMSTDEAASSLESLRTLTRALRADAVDTLVCIGVNPVYDAPADLKMGEAIAKAKMRVHLGMYEDETCAACVWHVNRAHYLESWGDVTAADGTASIVQPMIAPLFGGKSDIEFLAALIDDDAANGYAIVRRTWRDRIGVTDIAVFNKSWRRGLHDGLMAGTSAKPAAVKMNAAAAAARVAAWTPAQRGPAGTLEVAFCVDPRTYDGRFANNGWLQELPHPISKVTWDNPVLLSPATARKIGVAVEAPDGTARPIAVIVNGRRLETVAWVVPGIADDTLVLTLGGGRSRGGRIAEGTGQDVYSLRETGSMWSATGAQAPRRLFDSGKEPSYHTLLACTQDHHSLEGRPILREVDLAAWRKFGDEIETNKDAYGRQRNMNFAARLGDETHLPVNRDVYLPSQAHGYETDPEGKPTNEPASARPPADAQQWGMAIDLTTCTGCGACVTACQAENNIPIVGKPEVWKGREMHWIRVDRYFSGDEENPELSMQPVACVHCENAPCETVCPVNATIHGPEGLNEMAYNRCIGTRYCSNNCPYKVRRFNWFDYASKEFRGSFGQLGEGIPKSLMPRNENFVPPRLREKVSEVRSMQYNPNVTVRYRGVMEKCTYCIQRINRARVETKLQDLKHIPDGFFEVACQQACPSEAIVFGDISDTQSRVSALREHGRSYMLLYYLNTRPRTTHMVRLRNPNPRLVGAGRRERWENPFHHGGGEGHGGEHGGAPAGGHASLAPRREDALLSLNVLPSAPPDPSRRRALASALSGVLS